MTNTVLAIEFLIYILSLIIGFRIAKGEKDTHNIKYHHYKQLLFWIIALSFVISTFIVAKAALEVPFLWHILLINILFALYFVTFYPRATRCWKQHRMVIYHFLLLPLIYFCSLVLDEPGYNYYVLIICIYNIIEFQFAKFKISQTLIWD